LKEAGMKRKPMSWMLTSALLALVTGVTFGLDMAFNPTLRYQAGSIHSIFWQFAFPAQLVSNAVLVTAIRFLYNRHFSRPDRTGFEPHQGS